MPQRDIVVIGGSMGSIGVLNTILGALPAEFPASILGVIHVSPDSPGVLDDKFSRSGPLPVSYASDRKPIQPGHVYIARADYHLSVENGTMRLLRGPRENRHRPAIDPLFRTAARAYGGRVIGVVLSGLHDDGSAGLYAVKQRGGIAIVQDPEEASSGEMPRRAIKYAQPQYVLRAEEIGPELVRLANAGQDNDDQDGTDMSNGNKKKASASGSPKADKPKADKPERNLNNAYPDEGEGTPSVFACPECHGVLWELKEKDMVRFRCRVGHSYGQHSLKIELSQASETALWAAMRALEEKAAMQRRVAEAVDTDQGTAARLREQSKADEANAGLIRDMIFGPQTPRETGGSESKKVA